MIKKFGNTKLILSSIFPFKKYISMSMFGLIFWRIERKTMLADPRYVDYVNIVINHEKIHTEQMKDFALPFFFFKPLQIIIGGIIFYIIYFLNWLINLIIMPDKAYRNICFEKEAYNHEKDMEYIENRKHFQFLRKEK